jgi:hypothetical protein
MRRIPLWLMVIVAVVPTVLVGNAISAQDKYTVQVPGGLAFSEFKGYENWQVISRGDPRESRDDRGLPGRGSRQRQTFP